MHIGNTRFRSLTPFSPLPPLPPLQEVDEAAAAAAGGRLYIHGRGEPIDRNFAWQPQVDNSLRRFAGG